MTAHDPKSEIEQIQRVLSSPLKKIGFLFGAGISMKKMDDSDLIIGMNDEVITGTSGETIILKKGMTSLVLESFSGPEKSAISLMVKEIRLRSEELNIENILSMISKKEQAAGGEKLCGLTKIELINLRKSIEKKITGHVSIHTENNLVEKIHQNTFAKWVKNAQREFAVEIFTTNYDYLIELSLENQKIPYFDGFIGSYEAFFCPEWIESDDSVKNWVKLWKLHGSLGWELNEKNNEVIRTSESDGKAMIYPSYLKYDNSKKQPYLSYMDRLSSFLRQEDSVLFVCGYSFGDQHINEMIITALSRSRSSHVFVFMHGELKEEDNLSKKIAQNNSKISMYGSRTAIIGCKFGEWKLDREPDENESYNILDLAWDEDATLGKDEWTGKGNFRLGDFKYFTNFLSNFYSNSRYIKQENEK